MNAVKLNKPRQPRQVIWQALRDCRERKWYVEELAELAGVTRQAAHIYAHALVLAGLASETELRQPGYKRPRKCYRLLKDVGRDAPRLKADGTPAREPLQDVLWRTMKILHQFTVSDLVAHVCMTHEVSRRLANDYTRVLEAAGYLKNTVSAAKKRFVLLKNTGGRAPRLYLASELYDPNLNEIVAREVPDYE